MKFVNRMLTLVALIICMLPSAPCTYAAADGGLITKPAQGIVRFCDYQSKVTRKDMLSFFMPCDCPIRLAFDYKAMNGSFDIANANSSMGDANIAVFIVDEPGYPMSLIAQEEKWGLINIAKLEVDKPNRLKLLRRTDKLVTRVCTALMGGGYSQEVQFSAMQPVYTLEDLDRMIGRAISPNSLTQISNAIRKLGLTPSRPYTYEQACMEGWAPAPTNATQKAIWDEVHTPPKNPMKIEFDPKKGR